MNPLQQINDAASQQLKKIKALFNEMPPVAPVAAAPVQLMEYTLEDGTVVKIDKLEAGGMVTMGDAPAPAGEYKLADGTVCTVGEGGIITAVVAPEMPDMPEDMNAQYTQRFEAMETKLSGFEQALALASQENAALKETFAKQEQLNQQFLQMFETLVKEPDTTPTQPVNNFRKHTVQSKTQQVLNVAGFAKQLLNK